MSTEIYPGSPGPQPNDAYGAGFATPPPPDVAPRRGATNRIAIIAGAILALVVVLGGIVFAVSRSNLIAVPGALSAAQGFCSAVKTQNYPKAYTYLSPSLQQVEPQDAFVTISQGVDARDGKVTNCAANSVTVSKDGKTAVVNGNQTRASTGKTNIALSFASGTGGWKINQSPDPSLLPLTAAYEFCKDIGTQNYTGAYAQLSPAFQQSIGDELTFVQSLQQTAQVTGALTNCRLQKFTLGSDKVSGTINSGIDFDRFQNVPSTLSVVPDTATAAWKIDNMTIQVVGIDVPFPLPASVLQLLGGVTGG